MPKLTALRSWVASRTLRYHTTQLDHYQNLADHHFGVLTILMDCWPDSSREAMMGAMAHDLPEYITGDMPHMAKVRFPELRRELEKAEKAVAKDYEWSGYHTLTSTEKARLRFCDVIECYIFSWFQIYRGNQLFTRILKRCDFYLSEPFSEMTQSDQETCSAYFAELKRQLAGFAQTADLDYE